MAQDSRTNPPVEKLPIFGALSASEREILSGGAGVFEYKAGQPVCSYHFSDSPGLILLLSGRLNVYLSAQTGRQVTIGCLRAGDYLIVPERAMRPDSGFVLFTEAERDLRLLRVSESAWRSVTAGNVRAMNFSLRIAADTMTGIALTLFQMATVDVSGRLKQYLLEEYERAGRREIAVTHERIARALSTSREVVTRQLRFLSRAGAIRVGRGRIWILNAQVLKDGQNFADKERA